MNVWGCDAALLSWSIDNPLDILAIQAANLIDAGFDLLKEAQDLALPNNGRDGSHNG